MILRVCVWVFACVFGVNKAIRNETSNLPPSWHRPLKDSVRPESWPTGHPGRTKRPISPCGSSSCCCGCCSRCCCCCFCYDVVFCSSTVLCGLIDCCDNRSVQPSGHSNRRGWLSSCLRSTCVGNDSAHRTIIIGCGDKCKAIMRARTGGARRRVRCPSMHCAQTRRCWLFSTCPRAKSERKKRPNRKRSPRQAGPERSGAKK